jgi:hypothetical protein
VDAVIARKGGAEYLVRVVDAAELGGGWGYTKAPHLLVDAPEAWYLVAAEEVRRMPLADLASALPAAAVETWRKGYAPAGAATQGVGASAPLVGSGAT